MAGTNVIICFSQIKSILHLLPSNLFAESEHKYLSIVMFRQPCLSLLRKCKESKKTHSHVPKNMALQATDTDFIVWGQTITDKGHRLLFGLAAQFSGFGFSRSLWSSQTVIDKGGSLFSSLTHRMDPSCSCQD